MPRASSVRHCDPKGFRKISTIFVVVASAEQRYDMFKNSLNTWNYHWLARKENASSSKSGLYYSHWSAQSQSNLLSSDKYNPVNLALNNCTPLDRWQQSVSIMLEKNKGNINVAKLRAILLLEADFNGMNKITCNS